MKNFFKNLSDQKLALGSPSFYFLLGLMLLLLSFAFANDYAQYGALIQWLRGF